uniref:Uncharacterized protein n=1 Tax=Glossina brevipalpis TaxID=37001 RepID=A0A1A9W814_9MUSC
MLNKKTLEEKRLHLSMPAIWLLELDKVQNRLDGKRNTSDVNSNVTTIAAANNTTFAAAVGVNMDTWITLIEQFLMLILIVGRWMLPKGTAADIIEFFDSYKDDTIAKNRLLVHLTLGIWSWSLLQFTIVLSATRSRRPRGGGSLQRSPAEVKENSDDEIVCKKKPKKDIKTSKKSKRKDTGYSTASSQNLYATKASSKTGKSNKRKDKKTSKKSKNARSRSPFDNDVEIRKSRHGKKSDKLEKKKLKKIEAVIEEPSSSSSNSDSSNSTLPSYEVINEKKSKTKRHKRSSTSSSTSSDTSSSESS